MQASNTDPRQAGGIDQYRRKRRDALDRLVDREILRLERCERARKTLAKIGLAILTGVVPALIAGFLGWIGKLSDLVSSLIHGAVPK